MLVYRLLVCLSPLTSRCSSQQFESAVQNMPLLVFVIYNRRPSGLVDNPHTC